MQAALTAVPDHELPRDLETINLKALWGNNPKVAIVKLTAADMIEDLKLIRIFYQFQCTKKNVNQKLNITKEYYV